MPTEKEPDSNDPLDQIILAMYEALDDAGKWALFDLIKNPPAPEPPELILRE